MGKCIQCGGVNERKGAYCSKSCNDKAYRQRKKRATGENTLSGDLKIGKGRAIGEPLPFTSASKWCNFCGKTLPEGSESHFCDKEHEKEWREARKNGEPLKLKINSRTEIQTKKYDRVQEVIERITETSSFFVKFS